MTTKDFNYHCRLVTLFFSGTRAQAFSHYLDTDVYIEKREGVSDDERLSQLGEISFVDEAYLEGRAYTLTMEDKKKVFFFGEGGRVFVDVNELAFIIAAFYWRNDPFIKYHEYTYLFLESLRIDNNVIKYSIGS